MNEETVNPVAIGVKMYEEQIKYNADRIKDSVAYWQSEGYVLVHRDDVKNVVDFLRNKGRAFSDETTHRLAVILKETE